jgi:hypothetical protein
VLFAKQTKEGMDKLFFKTFFRQMSTGDAGGEVIRNSYGKVKSSFQAAISLLERM